MKLTLSKTGFERRRKGPISEPDRKAAFDGTYTEEQQELLAAVQTWKRVNRRNWPAWTEILQIFKQLGYRKVLPRDVRLDGAPEPALWWNRQ